jgi:hypothetical protein
MVRIIPEIGQDSIRVVIVWNYHIIHRVITRDVVILTIHDGI